MRSLICALMLTALLLPACNRAPDRPAADTPIRYTSPVPNDRDPQRMSWSHDVRATRLIFETLLTVDWSDLSILPGVAESWELSDDGLIYTFHLRDDARWSNGDPVTAHDFVYAWRRALMPDTGAQYVKLFDGIAGATAFSEMRTAQLEQLAGGTSGGGDAEALYEQAIENFEQTVGVRARDDRTLVVTLDRPVPYFRHLVAFVTFAPNHVGSMQAASGFNDAGQYGVDGTYWNDPARLIANGPYTLASATGQQRRAYEPNPHYWNAPGVRNHGLVEIFNSDSANSYQSYEAGDVDFVPDLAGSGQLVVGLVQSGRDDVHSQHMAGTYFYNFNCLPQLPDGRDNPFADPRVRRAFAMAVDRQLLVDQVNRLGQPVARSYIPPAALPDYQPPVDQGIRFDPDAARALLAEAGYPGGEGLDGLSILFNTGAGHGDQAQAIARMWQQHLGVDVSLEGVAQGFGQRLRNHEFSIARASWFGDYPDPTTWLDKMSTGDGNNDCGWSNSAFDALLVRAARTTDADQRMQLLSQAEAIILRESPMLLLYHYVNVYLWDPDRLDGLEPNAWGRFRMEDVARVQ